MKILLTAFLLLFASSSFASTTYYIRTDGGDSTHCSGLVDAPYSGNVFNRACAFHHPFDVLPPNIDGNDTKNKPLMQGGDTLIIGPGSYQLGLPFGAGIYDSCKIAWGYDCRMQPVPSGTISSPTRILGAGYAGCPASPASQLWGSGGSSAVVNLTGSSNVVVSCLEITDHSNCIQNHPNAAVKCQAGGAWASNGITDTDGRASNIPSTNVTLQDLNIHGLAKYGVLAGNISGWTVKNVKINANGFGGWSTDLSPAYSISSGTNIFSNVEIAFNGCAENFPNGTIWGCWGQMTGGYGDGFGSSSASDKGTWTFTNVSVHDNTQDGLDFLHADPSAVITFDHVDARNNAGNQLKTNGVATITNSVIVGGCSLMQGRDSMQGSPGGNTAGDLCRAMGDTVVVGQSPGQTTTVDHNTIISQGNTFVTIPCPGTGCGDKTSKLNITNNIMVGLPRWVKNDGHLADIWWWGDGTPVNTPTWTGNVFFNTDVGACPTGNTCADPRLTNETLAAFDPTPTAATPPNVGAIRGTVVSPPAACVPVVSNCSTVITGATAVTTCTATCAN